MNSLQILKSYGWKIIFFRCVAPENNHPPPMKVFFSLNLLPHPSVFHLRDHFVNSHNLFSCLCADIVGRNLMLTLLGLKGLKNF